MLALMDRVAMVGVPKEIRDIPSRTPGSLKHRQTDAFALLLAWGSVAVLGIGIMGVASGGYNLVTGHVSSPVLYVASSVSWFGAAGATIQLIRIEVAGVAMRVSAPADPYVKLPGRLLGWLLTPRDGEMVLQLVAAAVIVALELGARP
jgi:hypothetical protein